MSFLSRLAVPAIALALTMPVALHAQNSGSSNSGSTNAGSTASQTGSSATAPQPRRSRSHRGSASSTNPNSNASAPVKDQGLQTPDVPADAKPGTDPVNRGSSPEPPTPTTQGPPPKGTMPNTNHSQPPQ